MFDRYSRWKRAIPGGVVPSNVSYAAAGPSRLGAFEVHLIQGSFDPKRCCPRKLDPGQHHAGPAVCVQGSVMCSACADTLADLHGDTSSPIAKGQIGDKEMSEQHTLMHSKLWTRRWPNMRLLLKDIACAVIPPPPPRGVDFQMLQAPTIQFQPLTVIPLAAPGQMPPKKAYPEDRAVII